MDDILKKKHDLGVLKSRHDRLEERLSDLLRKAFRTDEETQEINRIKWEKRDLKEKIAHEESLFNRHGERA
ncbi:MAG: hypothetical protein VST70_07475 [Nitrospirota bacterium]|nr:hypothetical protein [Nitrospirota bacterium]